MRRKTLGELGAERPFVVIERRRGNRVRWRNRATGEWHPGWFALFVNVPKNFNIVGMTTDEFNETARTQGWSHR